MKKLSVLLILSLFIVTQLFSQELRCNVTVSNQKIQGANQNLFRTMQADLYEFVNNRKWTEHVYTYDEKIRCNILIRLDEQISADEFKGTLQIQSRRPVFNTNYNSVMLNYMDKDIHFRYVEFEPMEFDETKHLSNLTSLLAYYAYIIIGLDYDSFSYMGGSEYFRKAENIVNNAQNAREIGWKSFESTEYKNRYWLINNIVDDSYSPIRDFLYQYHRHGLDVMDEKVVEARTTIAGSLEDLQKVYRDKPDPFMHLLRVVLDAKADEFINIFTESFTEEKNRVLTILNEIDPANQPKYQKISQAN